MLNLIGFGIIKIKNTKEAFRFKVKIHRYKINLKGGNENFDSLKSQLSLLHRDFINTCWTF